MMACVSTLLCFTLLLLDAFCSPDNINSAYHITIKARGGGGTLRQGFTRCSSGVHLQINHRVDLSCQLKLLQDITGQLFFFYFFIQAYFAGISCLLNE